jgi:hypothetical protein
MSSPTTSAVYRSSPLADVERGACGSEVVQSAEGEPGNGVDVPPALQHGGHRVDAIDDAARGVDHLVAFGEGVVALAGLAVPDIVDVGFRGSATCVVDDGDGGWIYDGYLVGRDADDRAMGAVKAAHRVVGRAVVVLEDVPEAGDIGEEGPGVRG